MEKNTKHGLYAAIALVAACAGSYFYLSHRVDSHTIAITAFVNESHDPQWHWLSKSLPDLLLGDMAKIKELKIADPEHINDPLSPVAVEPDPAVSQPVASKWGIAIKPAKTLTGSYRIAGNQITLAASMTDNATGKVEKLAEVSGTPQNILSMEKELLMEIASAWQLTLGKEELDALNAPAITSADAAKHYYQGVEAFASDNAAGAIDEFKQAQKADAGFDAPLLGLGQAYEKRGDDAHALEAYKAAGEPLMFSRPAGPHAAIALFDAMRIAYLDLHDDKQTLQLASNVIQGASSPPHQESALSQGDVSQQKDFLKAIGTPEQYIRDYPAAALPMTSYMHLVKFTLYEKSGQTQKAIAQLEYMLETHGASTGFATQNPPTVAFWNDIRSQMDQMKALPLTSAMPDCPTNRYDPSRYSPVLARWDTPTFVVDMNQQCTGGDHPVENLTFFQDKAGTFQLLWTWQNDIWMSSSPDGKEWAPPERLPTPINSEFAEFYISAIQGVDGKYYLAFFSNRKDRDIALNQDPEFTTVFAGAELYFTSSSDMHHWSDPAPVDGMWEGNRRMLLQLKDGSFRYYTANGWKNSISFIASQDFVHWTGLQNSVFPGQRPEEIIQTRNGNFWLLSQQFDDTAKVNGDYFVISSNDGATWGTPMDVTSSATVRTQETWPKGCMEEMFCNKALKLWPYLIETQSGELALEWRKGVSVTASKSKDGHDWTPSQAPPVVGNEGSRRNQDRYPFIQAQDGRYAIAYSDSQGQIWVAFSRDPFY